MSLDPVEPPASAPPRPVYNWKRYKTFPECEFVREGPGLFVLLTEGYQPCKFTLDRITFTRRSIQFSRIFNGQSTIAQFRQASDGTDVVEVHGDDGEDWKVLIQAIYDPLFLTKTLPQQFRAMSPVSREGVPCSVIRDDFIRKVDGILRIASKYDLTDVEQATKETVAHQLLHSPLELSRLLEAIRPEFIRYGMVEVFPPKAYPIQTNWGVPLLNLLQFAHRHSIFAPIPSIYYLLLSVYGANHVAVLDGLPNSDKIRCIAAAPYLLTEVSSGKPLETFCPRNNRLWGFANLPPDRQLKIWEALPEIFHLGTWADLEDGKISSLVS